MSVASLLITVKPPRVRGFIYVVAGRPAWVFGHRSLSSQIRYNGFSPFPSFLGTDRVFLRIVPLGLFLFGHSSVFCKKSSNYLWNARRTFRQNTLSVPNLAS